MQEVTPRSSTTSVDISARGITGQEDNEDSAVNLNFTNNDSYLHGQNEHTQIVRGNNRTMKMILLTQCLAGLIKVINVFSLIMQPIVGSLSDNSKSRFGRRRPFLLVGSLLVICALICMGWTKEIVGLLFGKESSTTILLSMWLAVFSMYLLDFAINCVQASCRAIIVDSLPPSQQEEGTAWAGRMVGIGSVVGYFMGFVNLVDIFPFFGKTQLQILCVLASIILLASDALTCWAVNERINTESTRKSTNALNTAYETLYSIMKSVRNLPKPVQLVCNVQFFAWIGWFPFLFYATTWVSEVHSRSTSDSPEKSSDDSVGDSTRVGSFSLLLYSLVSLLASFILPFLVSPAGANATTARTKLSWKQLFQLPFAFLTVPKLWTISHFIFAFSMLITWFVTSDFQASIVISLCGISWAIIMWAPFSILGEYISKESGTAGRCNYEIEEENNQLIRTSNEETRSELPFIDSHGGISTNDSSEAGVLLGIHNMYIVLPQFLVTFFSSIIFAILEPGDEGGNDTNITRQHPPHPHPHPHDKKLSADSIGFVLRFGGFMAIFAGILSIKLWKNK
ncbi:6527_t:CDS:2 [Funneliformis geosporum]|uniref:6527_t:CDS:1 n=1 Tax=Funneliformis geosporum TaxID=1117311 RepID=A0A9W4SBD4_9GLOM|nr:6527_t:CDS:2 [Funneliformis geosporum]